MPHLFYSLVFLAVFAVTAESIPANNEAASLAGNVKKWFFLSLSYSSIKSGEYISPIETIRIPRKNLVHAWQPLDVHFSVKFESESATAPLMIKMHTQAPDESDYSLNATGLLNIACYWTTNEPWRRKYQQTLNNFNPDTEYFKLLRRDTLLDPKDCYDINKDDLLQMEVTLQY